MRIKLFFLARKRLLGLLFLGLLSIALLLTILTTQQKQEIRQHAAGVASPIPTRSVTQIPTGSVRQNSYPASDGHIYWTGDFGTGDTSQWTEVHTGGKWGPSSIQVVTFPEPVRWGKYAGKFTVRGGGGDSSRAEITASQAMTGGYAGQEWFYSWSTYVPSNPNATSPWNFWANITQWMDLLYQCSPPLWVALRSGPPLSFSLQSDILDNKNGCAEIGPHHEWDLGTFQYDQWNDFTIHVKWSEDPTVGFVEMWRNGVQVVPLTYMRTLDTSGGVFMEQALYHPGNDGTHVLYHDGTRRHDAFNGLSISPSSSDIPVPTPLPTGQISQEPTPTFQSGGTVFSLSSICDTRQRNKERY
jgi:hypothetical protein